MSITDLLGELLWALPLMAAAIGIIIASKIKDRK